MRIFPEMWANTLWPFSSSTRNMAFGSGSMTVPSRTIASSLGFGSVVLLLATDAPSRPEGALARNGRGTILAGPPPRFQTRDRERHGAPHRSACSGPGEDLGPVGGDDD